MKKFTFQISILLFFICASSFAQKVFYKDKYYTLKNDKIFQRGKVVTKGLNNVQRDSIYIIARELYDERGKLKPKYKKRKVKERYKAPENFWEDRAKKLAQATNSVVVKSAVAGSKKETTTNKDDKVIAKAEEKLAEKPQEEKSKEVVQLEAEEDKTKDQEAMAKQEAIAQKKIAEKKQKEVENSAKELQAKHDNERAEQEKQRRTEEQKAREESNRKEEQVKAKEEKIKSEQKYKKQDLVRNQSKQEKVQKKSAEKTAKNHEKSVAKSYKRQEKRADKIDKKQGKQGKEIRKAEKEQRKQAKENKKTAKQLKKKEKALKNLEKATATLASTKVTPKKDNFENIYFKINKEKTVANEFGDIKLYFDLINNSSKTLTILNKFNALDNRIDFFSTTMECEDIPIAEVDHEPKYIKVKEDDYITVLPNSKYEFFIHGMYDDYLSCMSDDVVIKIMYNPFKSAEEGFQYAEPLQKDFKKVFNKITKIKIESENIKFKLRKQ